MFDNHVLCRECDHWFTAEIAGERCPLCGMVELEVWLPETPDDPEDYHLDRFGHAIRRKGEVVKVP